MKHSMDAENRRLKTRRRAYGLIVPSGQDEVVVGDGRALGKRKPWV